MTVTNYGVGSRWPPRSPRHVHSSQFPKRNSEKKRNPENARGPASGPRKVGDLPVLEAEPPSAARVRTIPS